MAKRLQRDMPKRRNESNSAFKVLRTEINKYRGTNDKKSLRKPLAKSRSFAPKALAVCEAQLQARGIDSYDAVEREEFFDVAIGSSSYCKPLYPALPSSAKSLQEPQRDVPQPRAAKIKKQQVAPQRTSVSWRSNSRRHQPDEPDGVSESPAARKKPRSWDKDGDDIPDFIEKLLDNSNRKAVGMGCLERVFGGGQKSVDAIKRDKRPYFTYWVTLVQLAIFIVTMITYKIAPIGFSTTKVEDTVLTSDLTRQLVSRDVKDNLWIGPTQEDLIHLGAKFSPCMRDDSNLNKALESDREVERDTACCINNDGSGCLQTIEDDCSNILSTWDKWSAASPGYKGRTSGTVCGQDPRYCRDVEPTVPDEWPDDISQWPMCVDQVNTSLIAEEHQHMTCPIVGRPCCIGTQGECIVTTREYCEFQKGYFHDTAALCSQVKCMGDICGMIEFHNEDKPDQFYRFFTSLFLHSGVLTMAITLIFQLLLMRELEMQIGWVPMAVVYLGGGVVGGLASVIFIPYYVETGPSGSQLAVLGALFVEVVRINNDETTDKPWKAIGYIIGFSLLIFLVGLILIDVNNWSNFFGLFYGICIALAFRPMKLMSGHPVKRSSVIATHVVCALLAAAVLVILVVLFYVIPITSCDGCLYFNCVPFTDTYCDGMSITISRNYTS